MFRLAVLALLSASASAMFGKVNPNSKQLRQLLDDATLVEGRGLANNNNQAAYYLNGEMADLSIKYTGCANLYSTVGNGNGNNNNNKNGQDPLLKSSVVTFEIREGCSGEVVGKYATSMLTYVDAYTENMMSESQWRCETYIETYCADCEGADDAYDCYTTCVSSGLDTSSSFNHTQCTTYLKQEGGENQAEEFNVQRYLECGKMQGNNNNNYAGDDYTTAYTEYPQFDGKFRVGPYCAGDGHSIMLGTFYDQYCSVKAPEDTYANIYGSDLPYSTSSIIPKSTCVSCVDPETANEYAQNQNGNAAAAREVCSNSYANAVKCENSASSYTTTYGATTSGCEFLSTYVPAVTSAFSKSYSSAASGGKAGTAFAWIFAFTTLMFGGYAYFLYAKLRKTGGLAARDGGALA